MALRHNEFYLPYGKLIEDAKSVAAALVETGLRPGEIVAVHVDKPVTHWVVTLALLRIGAVSVSLTRNYRAELDTLPDVKAIICPPEWEDLPGYPATLRKVPVERGWLNRGTLDKVALPTLETAERSMGRICFTSGTTGRPKAVLLDADRLSKRLSKTAKRTRIDQNTVLWCGLGADTAYGFTANIATWAAGGTVVLSNGARGTFEGMRKNGLNLILASPAALRPLIQDSAESALPPIDEPIIVAGGRLSVTMRDKIKTHLGRNVYLAYGSSEAGGITFGAADGLDRHPGYVGAVFSDVEAQIVNVEDSRLAQGETGLLRVRTESVASEYIGCADHASDAFRKSFFYSGDFARMSPDNSLIIVGRPADVLNFEGSKIRADDIENRIQSLAKISDACALQLPTPTADLVLIVSGTAGSGKFVGPAIRFAMPTLPRFHLIEVPELPRSSMGKFDRAALTRLALDVINGADAEWDSLLPSLIGRF